MTRAEAAVWCLVPAYVAISFFSAGCGRERRREQWPDVVVKMADEAGAPEDSIRVIAIEDFINREFAWMLVAAPDRVQPLVESLDLVPMKRDDVPARFFDCFPSYWGIRPTGDVRFFATRNFPFDSKLPGGGFYMVMHRTMTNELFVWCKHNFG